MPKWNSVFVIKLSPDDVIHRSAELYREFLKTPDNQRFSQVPDDGWPNIQSGNEPLQHVGRQDKVMIVAHATTTKVADRSADGLAFWLADMCGLKEAGLITFKCCDVGAGTFLEDFKRACAKHKIRVGWLKGYRGPASTLKDPKTDKPTEIIQHKTSKGIKKGSKRFKIIEGTHPFTVDNSRYFTDADDTDD